MQMMSMKKKGTSKKTHNCSREWGFFTTAASDPHQNKLVIHKNVWK
jgi:hypothetical protein